MSEKTRQTPIEPETFCCTCRWYGYGQATARGIAFVGGEANVCFKDELQLGPDPVRGPLPARYWWAPDARENWRRVAGITEGGICPAWEPRVSWPRRLRNYLWGLLPFPPIVKTGG